MRFYLHDREKVKKKYYQLDSKCCTNEFDIKFKIVDNRRRDCLRVEITKWTILKLMIVKRFFNESKNIVNPKRISYAPSSQDSETLNLISEELALLPLSDMWPPQARIERTQTSLSHSHALTHALTDWSAIFLSVSLHPTPPTRHRALLHLLNLVPTPLWRSSPSRPPPFRRQRRRPTSLRALASTLHFFTVERSRFSKLS